MLICIVDVSVVIILCVACYVYYLLVKCFDWSYHTGEDVVTISSPPGSFFVVINRSARENSNQKATTETPSTQQTATKKTELE